jgi:esterase/lipase superfamily enzyme
MVWLPTSQGRFYQNEDFGLVGAVGDLIEAGRLQVCCIDSVDAESFYANAKPPADRIRRHDEYDRYIAAEVVPFVRSKGNWGGRIGMLGCSFGAYHAANFGFRHPDLCDKVSVLLEIRHPLFLDGYWDDLCCFHCPTANVPTWTRVGRSSREDLCIVTGETDNILAGTTDILAILNRKESATAASGRRPTATTGPGGRAGPQLPLRRSRAPDLDHRPRALGPDGGPGSA